VAMDRWIFPLPKFTVFGRKFDLFQSGLLMVGCTNVFGLTIEGLKAFFVFGAAAFSVLALAVVVLRRSSFGPRLLAMKDSPAACATLGLNPTSTKLGVFALSAAIAGLGGAVYGGALRAVDAGSLDFFTGLAILMVMVIAGINSIGAALFTGMFLGTPVLANVFPSLRQLSTVLVGFSGVGLARNPNGFIPSDIRPRWIVMLEAPAAGAVVVAVLVAAWVLRLSHVLSNWQYAIASLVVLALVPVAAGAIHARRRAAGNGAGEALSAPLEWLGVTQPFQADDVAVMDKVLAFRGLQEGPPGGAA
jgi:branched-chain amino acid transport system permease protein